MSRTVLREGQLKLDVRGGVVHCICEPWQDWRGRPGASLRVGEMLLNCMGCKQCQNCVNCERRRGSSKIPGTLLGAEEVLLNFLTGEIRQKCVECASWRHWREIPRTFIREGEMLLIVRGFGGYQNVWVVGRGGTQGNYPGTLLSAGGMLLMFCLGRRAMSKLCGL